VIVGSWLEVFFQNALGIPDSLNSQFLVAHGSKLHQLGPGAICSQTELAHFSPLPCRSAGRAR
jgi:hypothetical protein